jgi:hypothetical protein
MAGRQCLHKIRPNTWTQLRYDNMRAMTYFVETDTTGTFDLALWPNAPLTIARVKFRTKAGSCTVQVTKNGTAIDGFGTAQNATTTPANVSPNGVSFVENDVIALVVGGTVTGLTGVYVTIEARV